MTRTRSRKNAAINNIDNIDRRVDQIGHDLQSQLEDLRSSIAVVSDEGENCASVKDQLTKFEKFMHLTLSELKREVADIKKSTVLQCNYLKKQSYRRCVVVHGIAEGDSEKIYPAVCNFFAVKMKADVTLKDLTVCYRMGSKNSDGKSSRPVFIQFVHQWKRDAIFNEKRKLKGTGFFISEMLISSQLQLLKQVRERMGDKSCWSRQGNVYALIKGTVKHIKKIQDISEAGRDDK